MTDIRTRLADFLYDSGVPPDDVDARVAELLSLPGIAIVGLPEPDHTDDRGWMWWSAKGKWDSYDLCIKAGSGVVEHRVRSYAIAKARALAAALLAAANAAEAQQ